MKLIIAGSRHLSMTPEEIQWLVEHFKINISEIVCGEALGIDICGRKYGELLDIPIESFPVSKEDWELFGKRAGHIRNAKMAAYGNELLLIWDGKSKGSGNMKENMLKLGKPVYEVVV